jgi:phage tail sheath protein FI
MPEYLAPGVYVEEIDTGSKPIEGVSTSTAGMVGVTERGPVNVPILVTSYGEYVRWFGESLNPLDFPGHCFLPHAADGFFSNGGKRLYVTRIIDTDLARAAELRLFHDAAIAPASTKLLRTATEATGSAASPPPLIALSGNNLSVNEWIRIDDGSPSEYRQVAAINAETVVVPLHLPFARSHDNLVQLRQFTLGASVSIFDLAVPTAVGECALDVEGTTAVITALAADQLLQIDGVNGEYRFIRGISNVADTGGGKSRARLMLDAPLALGHAAAANQVVRVTIPAAPPGAGPLLTPASAAGDSIVFVNNRTGAFNTRTDLVIVDEPNVDRREVRRIGQVRELTLGSAVTLGCSAGTMVSDVLISPSNSVLVLAGATTTNLPVNDVTRIALGQRILVNGVPRVVSGLTPGAGAGGTLVVTPALVAASAVGSIVLPVRTLQASSQVDTTFLTLDNRLGLAVGDVLRIVSGVNEEFVVIEGLPDRAAPGVKPDAGNLLLSQPLARAYDRASTEVTQVVLGAGTVQSTVAPLAAAPGATTLLLADGAGYGVNRTIALRTPEGEVSYHRITVLSAVATPMMIDLTAPLVRSHPVGALLLERTPLFAVRALDLGGWGNRLRISVQKEDRGLAATELRTVVLPPNQIRVGSLLGIEAGTVLQLLSPDRSQRVGRLIKVERVDNTTGIVSLQGGGLDAAHQAAYAALGPGQSLWITSIEFRLRAELLHRPDPVVPSRNNTVIQQEDFRHLSMDPRHSRYIQRIIGTTWTAGATVDDDGQPLRRADRRSEGESWLIRVRDASSDPAIQQSSRPGPESMVDMRPDGTVRAARHALAAGGDSIATVIDDIYIGTDAPNPENRTGLNSLRNEENISLVACPGRTSSRLQGALIEHCELMRYRFAVLDGPQPPSDSLNDVQTQRQQFDTKYAALYHPWVMIPHPFPTNLADIPEYPIAPSGHMLGIYARTDIERGVHKAPANEVVRGILGLRRLLNKEQHDMLNPSPVNINVIRDFRNNNRGIRVWGGRVITSDPDWKYVNVRRLLIYLEHSIDRGVQWVVFEPNADPLWARVRRTISNFLTTVWRNGALEGTTKEEAFFVKCDRTTMTQADIDNGKLICVIGVAPVKPAEFVIIRIGLWTAHAED